ncbi:hypothetical protein Ancab_018733 [Ancistrocladus abbreviatus]
MGIKVLLCAALLCLASVAAEDVEVTIRGTTSIATTDDNFVCATLDWWPSDKCDYGQCPWGKAGILNLDLKNEILFRAVKAFNPLRIRVGGSLEDRVVYNVGRAVTKCQQFKKQPNSMFGFSKGCLEMKRWDELNKFFNDTRAMVTFSLNALFGKIKLRGSDDFIGAWNPQNARDLMQYTISKGHKIDSWELGNELSGSGVAGRTAALQYAKDTIALKKMVQELYPDPATRPKVLAPSGFFDQKWYEDYLQATGPDVVDGVTHHIYNLGSGNDKELINRVQDPYYLDQIAQTYKDMSTVVNEFGPWAGAWVGEAGGAYNSGGKDVSDTFAYGFWYLDQLGMTATFNHKVYCRQALIGGNYALLNTTTFIPNPDYYGHRGVTVLLINMSNSTTFSVSLVNEFNLYPHTSTGEPTENEREEYHLTPKDGNIQSQVVLLNGKPLTLAENNGIPEMQPKVVDSSSPITVAPDSFVFVTMSMKNFQAPACA